MSHTGLDTGLENEGSGTGGSKDKLGNRNVGVVFTGEHQDNFFHLLASLSSVGPTSGLT